MPDIKIIINMKEFSKTQLQTPMETLSALAWMHSYHKIVMAAKLTKIINFSIYQGFTWLLEKTKNFHTLLTFAQHQIVWCIPYKQMQTMHITKHQWVTCWSHEFRKWFLEKPQNFHVLQNRAQHQKVRYILHISTCKTCKEKTSK